MIVELLRFIHRESDRDKFSIAAAAFAAGTCRGSLLATVNAAAVLAAAGAVSGWHVATFCALLGGYLATKYFADYRTKRLLGRTLQKLRLRLCQRLFATNLSFIEQRGTGHGGGELYANITHDLNVIANATVTFIEVFQSAVLLLFCLGYIGWLSLYGLLATLLTMITGITVYLKREAMIDGPLNRARDNQAEFFNAISDLIQGFKEIKLSRRRAADIKEHIEGISEEYRALSLHTDDASLRSLIINQLATFVLLGVLVFAIPLTGQVESLVVFQFLATVLFMIGPLETVVESIPVFNRANIALRRLQGLEADMAALTDPVEQHGADRPFDDFRQIRLDGVRFRFRATQSDDRFQLGPLDLELNRGEVLFIIGGNGSGKTTLIKLLTGLYELDGGAITIDGIPLRPQTRQAYRELFSTVFGDFHLFRQLYGLEPPSPTTVNGLLEELGLERKIHFDGVRMSSIQLSTGQRKRLAYLVSRLEDRRIYVLDEFAADQDPTFRRQFYRELLQELKRQGKTVIAVSHDDHYFDAGDRVVKLDYGTIEGVSTPGSTATSSATAGAANSSAS